MNNKEFSIILSTFQKAGLRYTPPQERLENIAEVWYVYFKDMTFDWLANIVVRYIENERDFPTLKDLLDYAALEGGRSRLQLESDFRRDYVNIPNDLKVYIRKFSTGMDWRQMNMYQKDNYINTKLIPAYLKQQRQNVINSKQIEGEK